MKIASITIFCNESFRLEPWIRYYEEYKDDLYLQIIVNNGSFSDNELLKKYFPDAVILYSESSNMIASYNLAIKYILENTEADSILQITNDLRIEMGGLQKLHEILFSVQDYGLISPILLKKDSEIVENYGAEINFDNMLFQHIDRDKTYKDVEPDITFRTGLPGGCFLTKRSVYETIGLQDEKINMYSDEVDMGIKCAQHEIKLLSTKLIKSWHQHVFPAGRKQRSRLANYYMYRNPIYLARKYYGIKVIMHTLLARLRLSLIEFLSCIHHLKGKEALICSWYGFKGCICGLIMKI